VCGALPCIGEMTNMYMISVRKQNSTGYWPEVGSCKHGNEPLGSIKYRLIS
jgi:hypothetical protein